MNFKPIKTKLCPSCNSEFKFERSTQKLCKKCVSNKISYCKKHNHVHDTTKLCNQCLIEKSHIKFPDESEFIECKICSYRAKELSNHIIKQHNITPEQYKKNHNTKFLKIQSLCDRIKGENNPGFNHGGKYSPFSKNFIKYNSEEDYKSGLEITKNKADKTKKENPQNQPTKIEFYLSQGYSLEESEELLSERQSTFSLQKCIEKHGEEIGFEIWKERQEKWLNTLNNKSQEEIDEINRKKSSRFNYKFLWNGNYEHIPGLFYVIQLNDHYTKIGITSQNVKKRYGSFVKEEQIKFLLTGNMYSSFQLEQILKHKLKEFKILPEEQIGEFGWTETFKISSNYVINIINNIKNIEEEFKLIYDR